MNYYLMNFLSWWYLRTAYFHKRTCDLLKVAYTLMAWHLHPFCLLLLYFISISLLGFIALVLFEHAKPGSSTSLGNFDLFFMSVSALTSSSLASVNMEDMSNSQFWVLIFLMFVGGEAFLSAVTLLFQCLDFSALVPRPELPGVPRLPDTTDVENVGGAVTTTNVAMDDEGMTKLAMKCLANVALGFCMSVNLLGSLMVFAYFKVIPSARRILNQKGLNVVTFSIFTTVSSFANCGFFPNNENMVVFREDSGLLWMVIGQILVGNTLYPVCLTLVIWALMKCFPRKEHEYLWKKGHELGYSHLFPWRSTVYLTISAVGFTVVQLIMFGFLEWESVSGISFYRKFVAGLFQSVNARHAGEMAFDLSVFSPALLVVYIVMMYLPPYVFLVPLSAVKTIKDNHNGSSKKKKKKKGVELIMQYLLLPQVAYLVVFVVLVCITERKQLRADPLNFNVLNIVFELSSAYGNVGLTTGYSCRRLQEITDRPCRDSSVSFSGKWSVAGKIIILVVMFFGRVKKFTAGGKAWVTVM
ncbi:sodium transporter HKT1-like [Nymphaea colorata]|nr:sodium transporter HKT1-like [Nymphaea colorata]